MLSPTKYVTPTYISIIVYAVMCGVAFIYLQYYPSLSDAKNYVNIAIKFRQAGYLSNFGNLWTYLYPSILYVLSFLSGRESIPEAVAVLQCSLYGIIAIYISKEVSYYSIRLGLSVLFGLLLNILVIILLVDTLTEGPTILLALALVWVILRAVRATGNRMVLWLIAGATLAAAALMVRPANITLVVAWHGAALFQCLRSQRHGRLRVVGGYVLGALIVSAVVTGPQLIYNLKEFGQPTIMPSADLGSSQITWGISMMKYATVVINGGADSVIYKNPFYGLEDLSKGALQWYLDHPVSGILTMAAHVFNAFSWDFPFVYIYDLDPWYLPTFPFIVWFLQFAGSYSLIHYAVKFVRERKYRESYAAPAIFVAFATGAIVSLNGLIAVENRFNILPTTLLLVFAVRFIQGRLRRVDRTTLMILAGILMLTATATFLTVRVQGYAEPIVAAKSALSR